MHVNEQIRSPEYYLTTNEKVINKIIVSKCTKLEKLKNKK